MAWSVEVREVVDKDRNPTGKHRLTALDDEFGHFYMLCHHRHDTEIEASECEAARERAKRYEG